MATDFRFHPKSACHYLTTRKRLPIFTGKGSIPKGLRTMVHFVSVCYQCSITRTFKRFCAQWMEPDLPCLPRDQAHLVKWDRIFANICRRDLHVWKREMQSAPWKNDAHFPEKWSSKMVQHRAFQVVCPLNALRYGHGLMVCNKYNYAQWPILNQRQPKTHRLDWYNRCS